MALVAPPLSPHRHQPAFYIYPRVTNYNNSPQRVRILQASLHPSTQTRQTNSLTLTSTSTYPPSLIEETSKFCHSGNLNEALTLLQRGLGDVSFDSAERAEAVGMLLQTCAHLKDVEIGRKIHQTVQASNEFRDDCILNTRIITMYSICGCPSDARYVFDQLPRKNLYQWNAMVSGYTRNELWFDSVSLFCELMMMTEHLLDNFTLPSVIKACAGLLDVALGSAVHGIAIKMGLVSDVYVGNSLIAMYGKCGSVADAAKVFEYMPERNLESFNLFREMLEDRKGIVPDVATERDIEMGMMEVIMKNSLIDMYSKCGFLSEAQNIFGKIYDKNIVSWNSMIGGYSRGGDVRKTFELLRHMQMDSVKLKPNEITLLNVFLKELHGYSIRNGFQYNELVANAFIAAYAKCGALSLAENVFYAMQTKTVSSWNALIGGYAQNEDPSRALDLYHQMTLSGLSPDHFSISSLILAFSRLKSLQHGKATHGFVLRNGLETDSFICGKPHSARALFTRVEDKNLNGLPDEALKLFLQMVSSGMQPDEMTITTLQLGKEAHYIFSGMIELSRRIFDQIKEKDVSSWSAIIAGYGVHGCGREAIELFEKMQILGFKPDGFTFIGILMACGHAGLVEEGLKYFDQMQSCHQMEPKLEHYACIVDMLGRAGQFEDALKLLDEMPMEPDVGMWNSLRLAEKLLELGPDRAENYVLASNLFAGFGHWDKVRKVRERMRELGLKKDVGRSWIEIGRRIYDFASGDLEKREKGDLMYSEKVAISFDLLKTVTEVGVRVYKNLQIRGVCHDAIKLVLKVGDSAINVGDDQQFCLLVAIFSDKERVGNMFLIHVNP
ncbi:hypothetical protein NMG60_11005827 [Bertholletia excelsa]